MGEKPVDSGDADVIQPFYPVSQYFSGESGFFGHRNVTGASCGYDNRTRGGNDFSAVDDSYMRSFIIGKRKFPGEVLGGVFRQPCD